MLLKLPLKQPTIALLLACLTAVMPMRVARAEPVPPNLRAALLLRTLAYDHSIVTRAGVDQLTVVVLHGASRQSADEFMAVLTDMGQQVTVAGLSVRVLQHQYESVEELISFLTREHAAVVYLNTDLNGVSREIATAAESVNATLVADDGARMPNGCALGFELAGTTPRIVVDEARARAAGMDLDAQVLALARVL